MGFRYFVRCKVSLAIMLFYNVKNNEINETNKYMKYNKFRYLNKTCFLMLAELLVRI